MPASALFYFCYTANGRLDQHLDGACSLFHFVFPFIPCLALWVKLLKMVADTFFSFYVPFIAHSSIPRYISLILSQWIFCDSNVFDFLPILDFRFFSLARPAGFSCLHAFRLDHLLRSLHATPFFEPAWLHLDFFARFLRRQPCL